jgi:hypothetical protein
MKHSPLFAVTAPNPFDQGRVRRTVGESDQSCRDTTVQAGADLTAFSSTLNTQPIDVTFTSDLILRQLDVSATRYL